MPDGSSHQPGPAFRIQWRLGTWLIVVAILGAMLGWLGPPLYRSLMARPTPTAPGSYQIRFPAEEPDDLSGFHLEPAETPFE